MTRAPLLTALGVATALLLSSGPATGVCTDPADPKALAASSPLAAATLSAPGPHRRLGKTVVAAGNVLYVLDSTTMGISCQKTLTNATTVTPIPVLLDDLTTYAVFAVTNNGYIYRINPESCAGTPVWTRSLKRSTCSSDGLAAMPAVQLRRAASEAFKARYSTDIVFVGTNNSSTCRGEQTENRVYALRATDGTVEWTFSGVETDPYDEHAGTDMDVILSSPYIDRDTDRLFVTTRNRLAGETQRSLWAIDMVSGALAWSQAVGDVQVSPMLAGDRIYVATMGGDIKAVSRDDGAVAWSVTVGGGAFAITSDIYAESRSPYDRLIGFVAADGLARVVRDDGLTGALAWETRPSGAVFSSPVAFDGNAGKMYIGANNGYVYQLNSDTGSIEASRQVGASNAVVGAPTFFFDSASIPADDVRMVVGSTAKQVYKFCVPWDHKVEPLTGGVSPLVVCSSDNDCTFMKTECGEGKCIAKVCANVPVADGTECDDGNINTGPPSNGLDTCNAGTCKGPSGCDLHFEACSCTEANGTTFTRYLQLSGNQGKTEVVHAMATNTCFEEGKDTTSAIYVHLFDGKRRPFTNAKVTFSLEQGTSRPRWRTLSGSYLSAADASTANGTAWQSSRRGTYYALLGPYNAVGRTYTVTVTIDTGCEDPRTVAIPITVRSCPAGCAYCGCPARRDPLTGEPGGAGNLKVTVYRGDTNELAKGAYVMVGYARNAGSFYDRFDDFVSPAAPLGNKSNVQKADTGVATFFDYGERLVGPFTVTAGFPDQTSGTTTTKFGLATVVAASVSEVKLTLPVAEVINGSGRYTGMELTNRARLSNDNYSRMAVVAPKRSLGFYAGLDPAELFDVQECTTGTDGVTGNADDKLVGENVYISGKPYGYPTEHTWSKAFDCNAGKILQASYHVSPIASVFPGYDFLLAAYDPLQTWPTTLTGWLFDATYEQIGFLEGDPCTSPATSLPLRTGTPDNLLTMSPDNGSPPYGTDIIGMTLTDYSTSLTSGRGAGDLFMHAHRTQHWRDTATTLSVPFFDLGTSGNITNSATWNLAALDALYLRFGPCTGGSGDDPRCEQAGTETMRKGRSTVFLRVGKNAVNDTCEEVFNTGNVARTDTPYFLKMLDMSYDPARGRYRSCAGGRLDSRGRCCAGSIQGTPPDDYCLSEVRRGDFTRHTLYLKRTTYHPDPGYCTSGWQPSVERFPYWVLYTPGEGADLAVPGISSDFPRACSCPNSVSNPDPTCGACGVHQRTGLPQRLGSGIPCTSDSQCQMSLGEGCPSDVLNGSRRCVVKDSDGNYVTEEYEWRADLVTTGLNRDYPYGTIVPPWGECPAAVPCTECGRPAELSTGTTFNNAFHFGRTNACLTAQSSNTLLVNGD